MRDSHTYSVTESGIMHCALSLVLSVCLSFSHTVTIPNSRTTTRGAGNVIKLVEPTCRGLGRYERISMAVAVFVWGG